MADVNLRNSAVSGRSIALTDHVFAADRSNSDAAAAWKSDTLSEVIRTILRNPTSNLTAGEKTAFRTAIGAGTSNFGGSYNDLTSKPTIPAAGLPTGGTTGQVLEKSSNTNYAVRWANASSGGGGRTKILLATGEDVDDDSTSQDVIQISWSISTQGTGFGIQTHSSRTGGLHIPHIMTDIYQLVVESEINGTPYDRLVLNVGPSQAEDNDDDFRSRLRFSTTAYRDLFYIPAVSNAALDKDRLYLEEGNSAPDRRTLPNNSDIKIYALQD